MRPLFVLGLSLFSSLVPVSHLSIIKALDRAAYAQSEQAVSRVADAAEIAKDFEIAEKMWRQRLAAAPEDNDAQIALGYVLIEQGKEAAAETAFRTALETDDSAIAAQIGLGLTLQQRGSFDQAETLFKKAIAADESVPYGYLHLGRLLKDRRDLDGARANFEKVVELAPVGQIGATGYWELGKIYATQDQPSDAELAYWRAVGLDPYNQQYWQSLLAVVKRKGNAAALPIASEISFLENREAEISEEREVAINRYFSPSFDREQIANQQVLLAQYPDNVSLLQDLGTTLRSLGEFAAAADAFRQAIALSPNNARAHYNLSYVLEDLGQESEESYQTAQRLSPEMVPPRLESPYKMARYPHGIFQNRPLELPYPIDVPSPPIPRPFSSAPIRLLPLSLIRFPSISLPSDFSRSISSEGIPVTTYRRSAGDLLRMYQIADLEAQIQFDPDNGVLYGILGQQLYESENFAEAAAAFDRMTALEPRTIVTSINDAGVARYQLGQFEDAKTAFERAISLAEETSRDRRLSEATYGDSAGIDENVLYTNLGFALSSLGDWQGAIALYRQVLAADMGDERQAEEWMRHLVNTLENLARANYAEQRWAIAEETYREMIRLEPQVSYRIADEFAATLIAQGKAPAAEAFYRETISQDPQFEDYAYPGLAIALEAQGRSQEAEALRAKFEPEPTASATPSPRISALPQPVARRSPPPAPPVQILSIPSIVVPSFATPPSPPSSNRRDSASLFPSRLQSIVFFSTPDEVYVTEAFNKLARERMEQGRYRSAASIWNKPIFSNEELNLRDSLTLGLSLIYQEDADGGWPLVEGGYDFEPGRCYVVPEEASGQSWAPEDYLQRGSACLNLLTTLMQ